MYKKFLIKLAIVTIALFVFGYVLAWGLYSYTVASLKSETVNYTPSTLKVNDGAYNGLQTANYPLQPNINMIQPDMGYTFTGKVYE